MYNEYRKKVGGKTWKQMCISEVLLKSKGFILIEVSDKWIIGENTTTTGMFDGYGTNTVAVK